MIELTIVSPSATLVHKTVESVTLPGTKGAFQVLQDHAPLLSSLDYGVITYKSAAGHEDQLHIASGFVEVAGNVVSVCVEQ